MGLALYPGSLKEQAGSISANLEQDNQNLLNILSNISQFVSDDALRSEAWTSLKNQLGNHEAVVQGLICANEAVIRANDTMEAAIGSEDLVEDELKDQIQSLERANSGMASIIESLESCLSSTSVTSVCGASYFTNTISMYEGWINMNRCQIEKLEEKLDRLYQIENDTKGLYDEADSLYEAAERGMEAIGKGWNGKGFSPAIIGQEWKAIIEITWDKRQHQIREEAEEFLKGLDVDTSKLSTDDILKVLKYAQQVPQVGLPRGLQEFFTDFVKDAAPGLLEAVGGSISKLGDLLLMSAISGPEGEKSFLLLRSASALRGSQLKGMGGTVSSIGKIGGTLLTIGGFALGVKMDIDDGKTVGEAVSHNVISTGIGAGTSAFATFLITTVSTTTPIGWVVLGSAAVGTICTMVFESAYEANFCGLQDGLNWVGEKIDDGIEWISDKAEQGKEWMEDRMEELGECISDLGEAINPFNWAW